MMPLITILTAQTLTQLEQSDNLQNTLEFKEDLRPIFPVSEHFIFDMRIANIGQSIAE